MPRVSPRAQGRSPSSKGFLAPWPVPFPPLASALCSPLVFTEEVTGSLKSLWEWPSLGSHSVLQVAMGPSAHSALSTSSGFSVALQPGGVAAAVRASLCSKE